MIPIPAFSNLGKCVLFGKTDRVKSLIWEQSARSTKVQNPNSCDKKMFCKNVSAHCQEEGCIRKYIPQGPCDFSRAGILHTKAGDQGPRGAIFLPEENLKFRGGCISRLEAVYGHSLSISWEVLILWCDNRWHQSVFHQLFARGCVHDIRPRE